MRSVGTLVAGLAFVLFAVPSVVLADGRVALVVGNSSYAHIGRLPNPENDAADITAALQRLGFEVTTELDADGAALNEALRTFRRRSAGADVSLVFYAGHGLEVDRVNYLVPVDARLEQDTDVEYEAVPLDRVIRATEATEGASLRLVILDACRDNRLAQGMRRTSTTRSISRGSFEAPDEGLLRDETLVAYAAEAGRVALDGTGRNSPYTAALLTHLEEPLELTSLFRRVRRQVLEETGGRQQPHEYGSLVDEHYLSGTTGRASETVADAASAAALVQQETVFWQSISNSTDPMDFRAYLEEFPNGAFARLATNRLAALGGGASAPPVVEDARPPARESPATRDAALARYIGVPITRGLGRIGRDTLGRVFGNLPAPVGNAYFAPSVTLTELSAAAGSGSYRIVCPRGERDGNDVTLYSCLLGQPAGGAGRPAGAQRASRERLLARYIGVPITRGLGRIGRDTLGRVFGNLPAPVGNAYFAPSVTLTELSAAAGSGSYRIVCPRGERDGNEVALYGCELR